MNDRNKGDLTMSEKYKSFEEQVKSFNDTFKVDFSYEDFETRTKRLDALSENFSIKHRTSSEDGTYRGILSSLFQQLIRNHGEGKVASVNPAELADAFEKLMDNYRQVNPKKCPAKNGGWKESEKNREFMEIAQKMSKDKSDYVRDQYLAGRRPLRQMRDELVTIRSSGDKASAEQLANAILMEKALDKTVKSRSFVWKVFHPIRNRAEKRDLKNLKTYVENAKNYSNFGKADELANADVTAHTIAELHEAIGPEVKKSETKIDKEQVFRNENEFFTRSNASTFKKNKKTGKIEIEDFDNQEEVNDVKKQKIDSNQLQSDVNGKTNNDKTAPQIEEKETKPLSLNNEPFHVDFM